MKFYICNTDWDNSEKLLEQYPCLNNYGFEITQVEKQSHAFIRDENGQRIDHSRTYFEEQRTVNIDSLEQLLQLRKDVDESIIIHPGEEKDPTLLIEIYDNYRE